MTWTIIDEGRYSEPIQQALEPVLLDRVDAGEIGPTLRFWYRERPAALLGRFQDYSDEVATGYVEERNLDVVRRITGGGAMFVEPGAVITYSMYLPRSEVPSDIEESYAKLDRWTIDTLRDLGIDVSHEPLNDIAHPDGKIGGAAQLRRENAVLHHTTMSYDLDIQEMLRVLRIGQEKVSDKAISSAEKRVARIGEYVDGSRDDVIDAMVDTARDRFDATERSLTDDELAAARRLADQKFSTAVWNEEL